MKLPRTVWTWCTHLVRESPHPHDCALSAIGTALSQLPPETAALLGHCVESSGLLVELLIDSRSRQPLLAEHDLSRINSSHYHALYRVLVGRQARWLHTDLLGDLAVERGDLERALTLVFGNPPQELSAVTPSELVGAILAADIQAVLAARIDRMLEHLYAATLTVVGRNHRPAS